MFSSKTFVERLEETNKSSKLNKNLWIPFLEYASLFWDKKHLFNIIFEFTWIYSNIKCSNMLMTLTFDLVTPKSIGGHLLVMQNLNTKFEVPRPRHSQVNDWKQFGHHFHIQAQLKSRTVIITVNLTFDLVTPPLKQWGSSTGHNQSPYQVWTS